MAALIAQDSDRLGILPGEVGQVVIPEPAPTHVLIAGFRLSIETGAKIAVEADGQGMHPRRLFEHILVDYAEARDRRARRRETKAHPRGRLAAPIRSEPPPA